MKKKLSFMIGLQVNIDFVMPVRISTGIFFALKCRLFSDHLKVPSGYAHIVTRKEIIPDAFRRLEADMYGAILGDIIGSPFEFDRGYKTKKFEFFTRGCGFTDDSVMTVAVAEALIAVGPDADEKEIEDAVVANMQDWGRRYPNAGYGGKFWHWLRDNKPKPYGSYGNGSAMRVSAAGWLYPTIERTREVARWTAAVTHNHPEGIKGAEATASCIFLARSGASKEDMRDYVEQEFHYDLSRTLNEIRPYYHHVESCQQTVPEAITAFLEAEDFEDALRNAVSLGGDTDTLAAITGSIAEAFFGIPAVLKAECRNRIDPEMNRVLDAFDEVLGRNNLEADESLSGNDLIENAISNLYENQNHESFIDVITAVCFRIMNDGQGWVPFVTVSGEMFPNLDVSTLQEGDRLTLDQEVRLRMDTVAAEDGIEWLYIFTNEEESHKKPVPNVVMEIPFRQILETGLHNDKVAGVVLNPFGKYFKADKKVIECIFDACRQNMEGEA